jgi:hypothetical protein
MAPEHGTKAQWWRRRFDHANIVLELDMAYIRRSGRGLDLRRSGFNNGHNGGDSLDLLRVEVVSLTSHNWSRPELMHMSRVRGEA